MAEMDLERFVEAPGRDAKIKEVRKMIDSLGIEYLYLQFVSVTGKIMGKVNKDMDVQQIMSMMKDYQKE